MLAGALRADGVDVRTGTGARAVRAGHLELSDGSLLPFDRLLLAAGRSPATDGLGLDPSWLGERGQVRVDARCRAPRWCGSRAAHR